MAQQRGRAAQDRMRQNTNNNASTGREQEETPTTNAACEQCRARKVKCDRQIPQCSNCERAGVFCEFPNRGKRVNHVKQLVEDVSGLAARLDSIDGTINSLARQMSSFSANVSTSTKSPSRGSNSTTPDLLWPDTEDLQMIFYNGHNGEDERDDQENTQATGVGSSHDPGIDTNIGLGGRITARYLFDGSRRILDTFLDMTTIASPGSVGDEESNQHMISPIALARASPTLEARLRAKIDSYPLNNFREEPMIKGPAQTVATPPRSLVDNSLEHFLDDINTVTPIFQASRLRDMIAERYSNGDKDEACDLCFNNIIVLFLGIRSCLSRMDSASRTARGMHDELLPAFLQNSLRAFSHLDAFLEPKLVNVQALASLALVVRQYHESKVFDTVCHLAVNVLKSIGFPYGAESDKDASELDETQKDLYWALFVMDKQRSYIAGRPFDLHFYDSDARLFGGSTPRDPIQQCRTAHIHMMSVWEEIYISLYSSRAFRLGSTYRHQQIGKLDRLSKKWCAHNSRLLSKSSAEESPAVESWRMELKYCFHVGQVLIHRSSEEESSKQVEVNNSRAALQVIQSVWQSRHTEATVALLFRLLRHYPMVALHGLFAQFLANLCQESIEGLALISGVAEALKTICDPSVPYACLQRINEGVSWYMGVAEVIHNAIKQLEASREAHGQGPKRPQGSLHPSPGAQDASHARILPAKKPRNPSTQPEANSHNYSLQNDHLDKASAFPWTMQDVESTTTSETQFPPFRTLTADFNPATLLSLDLAQSLPVSLPPSSTPGDNLYQFLPSNIPTSSSVAPKPPSQPASLPQTFSPLPTSTAPLAPISDPPPLAMPAIMKSNPAINVFGSSAVNLNGDSAFFDPFLGRSDFPDSWEAELADQPMPNDFFLQG